MTTMPGGLELRTARPSDLDQIGTLLAERGEESDALDHRLVVEGELGWDACAVVVDGDRVVSTATLLDETVRVGDVVLPAGQVELVATDTAYEGRGLVRALMGWAHDRSRDRGHLLQVMIGIPYFYRLFGYEYAIDIPRARALRESPPGAVAREPGSVLREATTADIPALVALQEAAQAPYDVAMPHPAERWRWLLAHEGSTTRVLERDGVVVASARTGPPDDGLLVAEAAAVDTAGVARPPRRPARARRAADDRAPAADHAGPGLGGPPRPRRDRTRRSTTRGWSAPSWCWTRCARCSRRACAPPGSAGTW